MLLREMYNYKENYTDADLNTELKRIFFAQLIAAFLNLEMPTNRLACKRL